MTIVNDEAVFNDASAQGNWTAQDFDAPTDNDTNASPSIYREGAVCQQWILKENITGGYTYTSTLGGTKDITGGRVVVFWFFITADADLNKLTEFDLQLSSDTGFTTNNARWDAKQAILDLDLYGWYPVVVYPTNPDHVTGTIVYSSIDSIGWYASTGAAGTKLSGFDQCHSISYLGGHSQTFTLDDLKTNNDSNDLGVWFTFGDFHKASVNVRIGGGTTTNASLTLQDQTLFFDNVQPEHNLGFIAADNTSGTNTFEIFNSGITWNEQEGTTPDIFTDASNLDIMRINASTFARGGRFKLRSWISDANTYCTNNSITGCDRVEPDTMLFTGNTISDTRETDITSGALQLIASHRVSGCTFNKGTAASHAIVITSPGTYTLSDCDFVGYNAANGNNDSTIRNESGGAVTINASGITGNLTYQNGASATTTINNNVSVTFSGLKDNTEVRVYDASTGVELDGIENATAGTADNRTFTASIAAATLVDYVIHNVAYEHIRVNDFTWPSTAQTLPIQQRLDLNYENP